MDIPMKLLEKYRGTGENGKIFPAPKYSTIRSNIKKIPNICGSEKIHVMARRAANDGHDRVSVEQHAHRNGQFDSGT